MRAYPCKLRAVLVDFDGTLVDSLPALWGCYKTFLGKYQVAASLEEFRALLAPSLFEIVEKLKSSHALPGTTEALYSEYWTLVCEAYVQNVSFFSDALPVLQRAKQSGLKLAIVTSAPMDLVLKFLRRFDLQDFFDALITSSKNEPSKPSPAIYKRALSVLGVVAEEALAIEDSPSGIRSATAAKLYAIQFIPPHSPSEAMKEAALRESSWGGLEEIIYGYQTLEMPPAFELAVRKSHEKLMLSDVEEAEVNRLWSLAQKQHGGRLFNGLIFSFVAFDQGKLWGSFVDYKYYMAQLAVPELKASWQIHPIAISCICVWGERVLLGQRSSLVTDFPGCFELAPSGGIEPAAAVNGRIDVVKQALIELEEEAFIVSGQVKTCLPMALVQELTSGTYEMCMRMELHEGGEVLASSEEYTKLQWMSQKQLKAFASLERGRFVPFSLFLIDKYL